MHEMSASDGQHGRVVRMALLHCAVSTSPLCFALLCSADAVLPESLDSGMKDAKFRRMRTPHRVTLTRTSSEAPTSPSPVRLIRFVSSGLSVSSHSHLPPPTFSNSHSMSSLC